MILEDKVYGKEEIREDVLIDLINSPSLERLKGVSQFGMPKEYYHLDGFSRYEHSLGALILLRRLNADLNEQIAGLLHDVSHTAFSHVVDWLIGDPTKEGYQDSIHEEMIRDSEIPEILGRSGFDYRKLSDIESFSLLEKPAPSLCVDRLDYAIREFPLRERKELSDKIISDLIVKNGQMAFKNVRIAEIFARGYAKLQRDHWAGDETRARYYLLTNALKIAIDKRVISLNDLKSKNDEEILNLLIQDSDNEILTFLELLRNGFKIRRSVEGIELKKKFRYIDPEVSVNGFLKPLSAILPDYKKFLDSEKQDSKLYPRIEILEKENEHRTIF